MGQLSRKQRGRLQIVLVAIAVACCLAVATQARGGVPGIVASYSFDEGRGAAASDHSGHGRGVVLRGVKWKAGKHGRALSFNGRSSIATVPGTANLHLTRGVTLEAWIRPTKRTSRTQTILAKARARGVVVYGLRLRGRRLSGVVRVGNKTVRAEDKRPVRIGRWQFVALTFDGKTLRVHRSGARVAKAKARGALAGSTRALTLGASATRRQFFGGRIDNVRIYSRALSARELDADRGADVADDEKTGPGSSPGSSPGAPAAAPPSPQTPSGFPESSTTGWQHTGVTLRKVQVGDSGPGWSAETVGGDEVLYVESDGAVLDSLNIPMCVKVVANNVTIKRSRIACASFYTINTSDPPTQFRGLTLTDVEIDGLSSTNDPGIAVMATPGATYTRLDVHGFESSGPRLASDTTLQDSYIHGFVCSEGEHSAGTSANDGGSNIRVLRNNIDISTGAAGCASNAIGIYQDFGTYNGVLIQGNLVNGGAYCIYTAQNQGSVNIRVEGNHFGRKYYPSCGQFGPAAQVQSGNGNTFIGNVWHDTGRPV